jgi:hypothetical protein
MEEMRNAHRKLVGKPQGKRPLSTRRYRWEDNIKIGVREIRCEDVDWMELAQDRLRLWKFCERGDEPSFGFYKNKKFHEHFVTIKFSRESL